jgi:polysaccharide biosynthesis/export protein
MALRCAALLMASILALAGCAKQQNMSAMVQPGENVPAAAASAGDAQPVPAPAAAPPAAAANPHGSDDGLLPSDPISNAPPMPVALEDRVPATTASLALAKLPTGGVSFRGAQDSAAAPQPPLATLLASTARNVPVYDAGLAGDAEEPYLLDAGDRVRVFVYGQPNLSRTYPIDVGGFIAVPLIGAVKARGVTVYELSQSIAKLLGVKYVRDPEVSVEIAQYRPFYILGEVRNAGQFPWVSGLTVRTAVAIAGGYTARATERHATVSRRSGGIVTEESVPNTYAVRPGDTVYIEERFF